MDVNELAGSKQGCRKVKNRISQPSTGITGEFDWSKRLPGQYFLTSYITGYDFVNGHMFLTSITGLTLIAANPDFNIFLPYHLVILGFKR